MKRPADNSGILKQIATYAPGSLIPAALTLVTSMVFTRIFSASAFGVYSLFLIVANTFKLVLTVWLSQSTGKFLPPEKGPEGQQKIKDAILVSISVIFASETLLGAFALAIAKPYFPADQGSFFLPVVAFVAVSSTFDLFSNIFAAERKAKQYVSYKLIDSIATFALRLLLTSAAFKMDIKVMLWSVVISNATLLPIMWAKASLTSPRKLISVLASRDTWKVLRSFLGYGLPMTIWYFAGMLLDVGDRYVLNFFLGSASVGIYDANYRLINGTVSLIVTPITITLHPYLMSISGSGNKRQIEHIIGVIIENLFLLGALAVGLVAIFHKDIALLLLGPEFREGSGIMPIVLVGILFFNIGTFAHKPFEIASRTTPMVVFALVSAIANLAFNFLLIPLVGYIGAAYATLLSYLLYTVCVGSLGRKIYPWKIDMKRTIARAAIVMAGVGAIWLLRYYLRRIPYGWSTGISVLVSCAFAGLFMADILKRTSMTANSNGDETASEGV